MVIFSQNNGRTGNYKTVFNMTLTVASKTGFDDLRLTFQVHKMLTVVTKGCLGLDIKSIPIIIRI